MVRRALYQTWPRSGPAGEFTLKYPHTGGPGSAHKVRVNILHRQCCRRNDGFAPSPFRRAISPVSPWTPPFARLAKLQIEIFKAGTCWRLQAKALCTCCKPFAPSGFEMSAASEVCDQGADGAACQLQRLTGALQHCLAAERQLVSEEVVAGHPHKVHSYYHGHACTTSLHHSLLSFAASNYVLEKDLQGCGLLNSTSSQVLKLQSADLY